MADENDPAWRRFYFWGFAYGANEVVCRRFGIRTHRDPREDFREYRSQIFRELGVSAAAREAIRTIREGIADGRAEREPRC